MSLPIRIVLDSNVFTERLETSGMVEILNGLTVQEKIVIYTTHVQADEIDAMSDSENPETQERAPRVRAIYDQLIKTVIPTDGMIWGVSKWGAGNWGDGSGDIRIGDIMTSNPEDAEDALIGITAAVNADILVANDKKLTKRLDAKKTALEVLCFDRFVERMRSVWESATSLQG